MPTRQAQREMDEYNRRHARPAAPAAPAVPARPAARMQRARRWIKRYRPTDPHRRHRLPDDQPKTVQVRTYTRRT